MLLDKKKIHFVGIGGIGVSGLARLLLEMGYDVSGSDLEPSDLTKRIEAMGGRVFVGHRAANLLSDVELAVYSSAIHRDNPELKEARRRKITIAHRAQILGELFNRKNGIAVTGTHGKTTTTALISVMLENSNLDPTVIIGGEVSQFDGNAKLGKSSYMVAEADESDRSFLCLRPFYSVITNIEMEHFDHYKTLDDVRGAYREFSNNLKKDGILFYNRDDSNIQKVLKNFVGASESFGFSNNADMYPIDIRMAGFDTSFKAVYRNKALGKIDLKIPGRHNILNALAAVLVGLRMGISFEAIANSMEAFVGAKRRFQLRSDRDDIMLIDDYAHHPTEIRAVLNVCRNWKDKRVVVIFQPHRYTRTKFLADDFGRCFEGADKLILTDIYAASEKAMKGISAALLYEKVKRNGLYDVAIVQKDKIPQYVMRLKKRGDLILVLGAGDIKKVADKLSREFASGRHPKRNGPVERLKALFDGKVIADERLASHTSFRIGGPADIWAQPRDEKELKKILIFAKETKTPVFVIGNGTNVLVNDSGFRGIVINLGSPSFKKIKIKNESVRVGAGFSLPQLVRLCCAMGIGGMESLVGIPGTVGGAVYMNAGGSTNPIYKNIGELVASLKVMDYKGRVRSLRRRDLEFGYRSSNLEPYIILEAVLKLQKGDRKVLASSRARFLKMKREKQVLDMPSAGCVFKNPERSQFTCGQMIDMLGLKGKSIGGAEVSCKHANFIVNRGGATCRDVLSLIEFIKEKVKENYNIQLELEVKVI